jgi:hypothetical protein
LRFKSQSKSKKIIHHRGKGGHGGKLRIDAAAPERQSQSQSKRLFTTED